MSEEGTAIDGATDPIDEKLAVLQKESEERLQGWQRARADYQNLKRESEEKQMRLLTDARVILLREILPLIDHLKQATDTTPDPEHTAQWIEGVKNIAQAWRSLLKKWNVQEVSGEGEPFDPAVHEAVEMKGAQADKVVKVLSSGYMMDEKLIMPARVVVGEMNEKNRDNSSITH